MMDSLAIVLRLSNAIHRNSMRGPP